jgi:hypothetical protein
MINLGSLQVITEFRSPGIGHQRVLLLLSLL